MLRLQPDAPENGATGGSDDYFNTLCITSQIAWRFGTNCQTLGQVLLSNRH